MNDGPVKPLLIALAMVGVVVMFLASIDRSADTEKAPVQRVAAQPTTPPSAPKEAYLVLTAGSPVCANYKDAIRVSAVVKMNNDMALHSILGRTQCELVPKAVPLKRNSVRHLEAGVAVVTLSTGTFYFPADSTDLRMLSQNEIVQLATR